MMKISDHKYVSVIYDLNVGEGEATELMEQATRERPLEFIFGTNSMLEEFEKQLEGLSEGDAFAFTLTPDQAYGDYDEEKVLELPKSIFEINGKVDEKVLFEGNTLPMTDTMGNRLNGSVVSVDKETVTMDFNHPLAGEIMHFKGSVIAVRDASAEEIAALFSGGGCGGCSGGCDCGSDAKDEADGCACCT